MYGVRETVGPERRDVYGEEGTEGQPAPQNRGYLLSLLVSGAVAGTPGLLLT